MKNKNEEKKNVIRKLISGLGVRYKILLYTLIYLF